MRRAIRNGSRVLSAILSAAMIFTSLPVSGMTAYAEESALSAEITEIAEITDADATAETAEDTGSAESTAPAESSAPATEGTAGSGEASTETTPTEGTTEGSTEGTTEGSTEGTSEGAAEGSTEEPTDGSTEGATEGSTEESTEGTAEAAEGATEGATEAATEGTTEPLPEEVDKAATEETEEEDAEASAFDVFPGMGEDYELTADEIADKEILAENVNEILPEETIEERYEDAEGIYALGEVVYLADSEEEAQRVADAYGGTLKSYAYGVATIELGHNVTVSLAIAAAADENTVLPAVWPNYYYELMDIDGTFYNDPALSETDENYQWMHDYIGDSYAWAAGYEGQGIRVAVIDSGVEESHEDLANAQPGRNFANGAKGTAWSTDEEGHGTHVAGIIAATADNGKGGAGIAPKAAVTGYRILAIIDDREAREADVLRAINAAVEDGNHIINMSLGGFYYSQNMADTIKNAYNNGVAVFCASGNESAGANSYPAAYPGAISVAAIDQTGARASFSNYGSTVDLAFPGVSIYSTVPALEEYYYENYTMMDGTSMASPAAAGTAAVILSARSDILAKFGKARVDALLSVMKKGATKSSSSGMGAGTTYLPTALGLSTITTVPSTPQIAIADDTYDAKRKSYLSESVTATISTSSQDALAIYYSTDGKTPTYKNGVVTNGTLLTDEPENKTDYTGAVELGGARKVTLKAIALNTMTGKVSKVATKTVILMPIPSKVEITQANGITSITAGKKVALKATVTPGYAISTKVKWSVDEAAAAAGIKVSNGTVSTTAKTPNGTYNITATAVGSDGKTYDGESDTYPLQVINTVKVTAFKLNPNKVTLSLPSNVETDLSEALVITLADPEQTAPEVVWSSSNTKIATVDASGHVTALAKGKATITAMLNDGSGKKAACAVTVNSLVTDINISGPEQVAAGKSITLTAAVTPSNATNKKITWKVEDNNLVTIKNGKLTAKKGATGHCLVTATAADGSGVYDTLLVTITASPITAIKLVDKDGSTAKSLTLFRTPGNSEAATEQVLTAMVTGGSEDAAAVEFSSSAPGVVSVRQEGTQATLTAVSAGKATITCKATDGSGKKASCTVNVNIPMSRIAVTTANGYNTAIAAGKSVQLVAKYGTRYGTPTNKKIVWSSDNPYFTVSQTGKVTVKKNAPLYLEDEEGGKSNNAATITARAADGSGVMGSITLYVNRTLTKLYLGYYGDGDMIVYGKDKEGNYYYPTSFNTTISGDAKAACDVDGCLIKAVPGKVTYPTSADLPEDGILQKYTQKLTVTVTLKDGSGLKAKATIWVARNKKGQVDIYRMQ